jgi:hypothetical protein
LPAVRFYALQPSRKIGDAGRLTHSCSPRLRPARELRITPSGGSGGVRRDGVECPYITRVGNSDDDPFGDLFCQDKRLLPGVPIRIEFFQHRNGHFGIRVPRHFTI